jgi:DMSO reductase anchor subunit
MCHGRLAEGEAPACVQACPTHAISIVNVSVAPGPKVDTSAFLAAAPDPAHTQPTTRYVSRRPLPAELAPADAAALHVQPAHWPLVLMLVGTQASVGALAAGSASLAAVTAAFGLAASVLHLGQPLRAWRAFLGLRRSWLSREIVVFGLYPPLLAATFLPALARFATPAALAVGLAGVACSVMIYADTPRREWRFARTVLHFAGTVALLALATAFALSAGRAPTVAALLIGTAVAKLIAEYALAQNDRQRRLRAGPLRRASRSRVLLAVLGGVLLPTAALLDPVGAQGHAALAFVALLAGELCERFLFFRSVDPYKMPGVASS